MSNLLNVVHWTHFTTVHVTVDTSFSGSCWAKIQMLYIKISRMFNTWGGKLGAMSHLSNDSLLSHSASTQYRTATYVEAYIKIHTHSPHDQLNNYMETILKTSYSFLQKKKRKNLTDSFLIHITIYSQLSLGMWKILCHETLFGSTKQVRCLCPVNALDPPAVARVHTTYILKWQV